MVKLTAQAPGTPWPVRLGERLTAFGNLSLALLLPLAVFWVALRIFNRHPVLNARAALLLLGVAVTLAVSGVASLPARGALRSEFASNVAANKAAFFIADAFAHLGPSHPVTGRPPDTFARSEEHTSELQSQSNLVCRLLLEKKKKKSYSLYSDIGSAVEIIMRSHY